jgi:site-specific DNA-methyltransferase (adenine-specific)
MLDKTGGTSNPFTIGSTTLYCGDCFDILPQLDIVADAVISDPPYGITDCDWDILPPLDVFWDTIRSKSKTNANFVLFSAGSFTVDLITSNRKGFRYDLVWHKSNKCGFLNANYMPLRNHEVILVFGIPGNSRKATYNPVLVPGGRKRVVRDRVQKGGGVYKSAVLRTGEPSKIIKTDGMRYPQSVLYFPHDRGNQHGSSRGGSIYHSTQKPVNLCGYLVMLYTNAGDVVVDPFMGSGSIGIACMKLGRRYIGIEKDDRIFEVARSRIQKEYERWNRKT